MPMKAKEIGLESIALLTFEIKASGEIDSVNITGKMMGLDSIMVKALREFLNKPEIKFRPLLNKSRPVNGFMAYPLIITYEPGDKNPSKIYASTTDYTYNYVSIMTAVRNLKRPYVINGPINLIHYGSWH